MSGINYEQRQIFRALVRFSDNSGTKQRPVLILSNNKHNKENQDLICCPITSKNGYYGRGIRVDDYEIEKNTLPVVQSQVKCHLPFFVHKSVLSLPENGKRIKLKKDFVNKVVDDIREAIHNK